MLTGKLLNPRKLKMPPALSAGLISKEAPVHGHVTLELSALFFWGQIEVFESVGEEEKKEASRFP